MLQKYNLMLKKYFFRYQPYTNTFGLARSILATGTLLTLIVNPISNFFHRDLKGIPLDNMVSALNTIRQFNFFTIFGLEYLEAMRFIAIIVLLITVSGFFIKLTAFLHWWIAISFFFFSSVIDGGDQIATVLTLLILPICLFDPRKNHWHKLEKKENAVSIISVFAIWLIRIQVSVIYFHACTAKLAVSEWNNGTAIYYWFNHSSFGMPTYLSSLNFLLSNYFTVSILTYGTILLEIIIFTCLFANIKFRKNVFFFAVFFHLAIIIIHGIFSFFFSITACLILFLLPTYKQLNFTSWFQKTSKFYAA